MGTNSDLYLIGIAVLIFLIIVFLYLRKISNSGKLKVKIEEVPESFKEDKSLEIEGQQAFEFNEEEIKSYEEDQELAILNLISVDRSMFDNDQVYGFLTNYGAILKNNYFSYQDINGNEIFRVANALNPGTFDNDTKTFAIVAASNLSLTTDPVDAVKQMIQFSVSFSEKFHASICDEERAPITKQMISHIESRAQDIARIKQVQTSTKKEVE